MRERQPRPAAAVPSHATKSKRSASTMTQAALLKCLSPQQPSGRRSQSPPGWRCCVSLLAEADSATALEVLQLPSDAFKLLSYTAGSSQELLVVSSTRVRRNPRAKRPSAATCSRVKPANRSSNGGPLPDAIGLNSMSLERVLQPQPLSTFGIRNDSRSWNTLGSKSQVALQLMHYATMLDTQRCAVQKGACLPAISPCVHGACTWLDAVQHACGGSWKK
jgi:hypothetical protein